MDELKIIYERLSLFCPNIACAIPDVRRDEGSILYICGHFDRCAAEPQKNAAANCSGV